MTPAIPLDVDGMYACFDIDRKVDSGRNNLREMNKEEIS